MEENIQGTQVVTEPVPTQADVSSNPQPVVETPQPVKTYTADQVKQIVSRRLGQTYSSFHNLMNAPEEVRNDKNLFANWIREQFNGATKSQADLDALRGDHETLKGENFNLKKELAFWRNNVDLNRENDIMAMFKGLDIPFSEEKLVELLATHPEWLNKAPEKPPTTTFQTLGKTQTQKPSTDEKAEMLKMLGAY